MNKDNMRSVVKKNKFIAIGYFFVFSVVFIAISWFAGSLSDFQYVIAGCMPFLIMVLVLSMNFCEKIMLAKESISESE